MVCCISRCGANPNFSQTQKDPEPIAGLQTISYLDCSGFTSVRKTRCSRSAHRKGAPSQIHTGNHGVTMGRGRPRRRAKAELDALVPAAGASASLTPDTLSTQPNKVILFTRQCLSVSRYQKHLMSEYTCLAPFPLNADVHSCLSRLDHSISCDNGRCPPNDQQS